MLLKRFCNSIYYLLIFIIIAFGFYLRIKLYSCGYFLRIDEINLHFNLIDHSFLDYFHYLDGCQIAPPFYMMLNKAITLIFGHGIYSVRFLSVFFGCLSVVAFFLLLQKVFTNKLPIIIGTLLFSTNLMLIFFSADFKPYILDVLVTIILLFFYDKINLESAKNFLCWAIVCFFLPFFSFTSIFILGAMVILKGFDIYKDTDRKPKYIKLFAFSLILLVSAIILYFINRDTAIGIKAGWYLGHIDSFKSLIMVFIQFFEYINLHFLAPLLIIIAVIWGFIKNNKYSILCTIIILLQIIAAIIHAYPFIERASLFLIPIFYILLVSVADFKSDKFGIKAIIFICLIALSTNPKGIIQELSVKDLSTLDSYWWRDTTRDETLTVLNMYQDGQKIICFDDFWLLTQYYNKMNNYNHTFDYVEVFNEPLKGFDVIEKELTEHPENSYWVYGIYNSFLIDFVVKSKEDVKELIEKTGRPYKVYPTKNGDVYFLEKQETE